MNIKSKEFGDQVKKVQKNDELSLQLIQDGFFKVDCEGGLIQVEKGGIWQPVSTSTDKSNYIRTELKYKGNQLRLRYHRVILIAHTMSVPASGLEADHIDGDRGNNVIANLRWVTRKQNIKAAMDAGTWLQINPPSHLAMTKDNIILMRKLHKEGWSFGCCARHFGVHHATAKRWIIKEENELFRKNGGNRSNYKIKEGKTIYIGSNYKEFAKLKGYPYYPMMRGKRVNGKYKGLVFLAVD